VFPKQKHFFWVGPLKIGNRLVLQLQIYGFLFFIFSSKYLAEKKMTIVGDDYTFHLCTFQWSKIYGLPSLCNRNGAEIKECSAKACMRDLFDHAHYPLRRERKKREFNIIISC